MNIHSSVTSKIVLVNIYNCSLLFLVRLGTSWQAVDGGNTFEVLLHWIAGFAIFVTALPTP